jgi:putative colanic acid biosynthesis UDP-glucose lipid carrier transferase
MLNLGGGQKGASQMISDRNRGIQRLVLICLVLLVTVSFWIWFFLCNFLPITRELLGRYLIYNEFILIGLLVGTWALPIELGFHSGKYEVIGRRSLRQLGSALLYLLLYLAASHDTSVSRLFLFSYIPLLYVVLFAGNRFLPPLLGFLTFRCEMVRKIILMGPRSKAITVKRSLEQSRYLGLEILGLVTEDKPTNEVENKSLPTLGRPEQLEQLLKAPGIVEVIMVEFPQSNGLLRNIADLCEERGVRLLVLADLDRLFGYPLAIFKEQGMFFIGLREEPLEDPINRFFKRCLDIAVSLPVVLFILPPLVLLVWICQRLQSPGPLLFVQQREGFQNRPFPILKFRSMHVGNARNEALPSSKCDPRLYPVGGLLRKCSLDEMPQFWNVLRGEMSVVGPRPHLTSYKEQYRHVFSRAYVRTFVKPGITGLAQVRGFRGNAECPDDVVHRMQSDIEYLENWSFWLDCWIIARTALQIVLPHKTAL